MDTSKYANIYNMAPTSTLVGDADSSGAGEQGDAVELMVIRM